MPDFTSQNHKLKVLEQLYADSRIQSNDLAQNLNLTRQTISKLRTDLWNDHIINSPAVILNPHVLNLHYAFMEIQTNPSEPEILNQMLSFPEVASIDGILGEYSLVIKFESPSKQRFAQILSTIDEGIARSQFHSYHIIETIDVFKQGGFPITKKESNRELSLKKWPLLQQLKKNYNPKKWPPRPNEFLDETLKSLESTNLSREFKIFEESGIIEHYSITLNKQMPDFSTKYILRIKPANIGEYTKLAEELIHHPNIIELYRTGEDFGLFSIVRTKGLEGFKLFIKDLYTRYAIYDTRTTVVVDEIMPMVYPPTIAIAEEVCGTKKRKLII
jgi:DNA-binding Lrp family transcriptional regulator